MFFSKQCSAENNAGGGPATGYYSVLGQVICSGEGLEDERKVIRRRQPQWLLPYSVNFRGGFDFDARMQVQILYFRFSIGFFIFPLDNIRRAILDFFLLQFCSFGVGVLFMRQTSTYCDL